MTRPTRIPSDVNRPDRVLGPFTARQSVILAATAAVLYSAWTALRAVVSLPLFLAVAVPLGAVAVAVALGHRDGLPLDRFLVAALRHHLNPRRIDTQSMPSRQGRDRRRAGQRPGPAGLFADAHITGVDHEPARPGVLDLGADGLVALAVVSTLNLGLRTPAEQDALVAGLARYLHTLTGPVQFLIRTVPMDLTGHLAALYEQARVLPHPALVAAALGHRAQLAHLATPPSTTAADWLHSDFGQGFDSAFGEANALLTRQVLLVLREPPGPGGAQRLMRRLDDAAGVLATLDVAVTPLPAAQITALLTDCCNPDQPSSGTAEDRPDRGAVPVAIVRRHPRPELDDLQHDELTLAQDYWPPDDPGDQPGRASTPFTTDAHAAWASDTGAVDFTLADDVVDELDSHHLHSDSDLEGGLDGVGGEAGWWGR